MGKKRINLQPWLDYFSMLRSYESNGFLEVQTDKHEAYVTQPALHAMSEGSDPVEQLREAVPESARRIRTYAAFRSCVEGYAEEPFAIHVVTADKPYSILYTMLLTVRRRWLRQKEHIEIIDYR